MSDDYRRYVGRQVVLQLEDDSLIGTLERAGRELLELANAATLAPGHDPRPIDGDVLVPRSRIHWVQVP